MFRKIPVKKVLLFSLALLITATYSFSPLTVFAEETQDLNCAQFLDFASRNDDRALYNPCASSACSVGSGSITGPAPKSLTGADNTEKVWNYLTGRGLTPVAAAGVMGTIERESGFDPWRGEDGNSSIDKSLQGTGFGLIQWTNSGDSMRRQGVMQYLEDNGTKLDASDSSQEDSALLYELNYLWDAESGATWQEQVNAETTVQGNTAIASHNRLYDGNRAESQVGNGSTLLFHTLIIRSGDVPTEAERINGYGVLAGRIESAEKFLNQYGNGKGGCEVGSGGLTVDQAKKFMDHYKDTADISSIPEMNYFVNIEKECPGKPNCTAFSTYFVAAYTDLVSNASGDGRNKVDKLLSANPGAPSGSEPKVFAVFQMKSRNHTGVILGIEGDKVIIGEANCGMGTVGIRVVESTVSEMTGGDISYLYTDNKVKNDLIMGVVK